MTGSRSHRGVNSRPLRAGREAGLLSVTSEDELMARTHQHHTLTEPATTLAGGTRALAILLVLVAFLLGPFLATVGKLQNAASPQIAQVVSDPSKASKGCPKKSLPGQPNACASSGMLVASIEGRGATAAPVPQRSSITPHYDVTLTTQFRSAPPDRPPRFAA